MKKIIFGIFIGLLISGGIVYAATLIDSKDVTYTPSDNSFDVSNVESALDKLYNEGTHKLKLYISSGEMYNEYQRICSPASVVASRGYAADKWPITGRKGCSFSMNFDVKKGDLFVITTSSETFEWSDVSCFDVISYNSTSFTYENDGFFKGFIAKRDCSQVFTSKSYSNGLLWFGR